uniref:Uncharacterized protein n=1 Tax=Cucumis melo TaxID=3656 RepID=A0A9I9DJR4_CUCME
MKGVRADEEDERNEREGDGTLRRWRLKKGKKRR